MNKLKLLMYSVIGLLLLNIGIICFLYFSRPNRKLEQINKSPKEIIIEKLHFDTNQIDKYETVIKIYKDQIDSLDFRNKEIKSELYSQLKSPVVAKAKKESIINLFLANQKRIEELHFKHFQDIKNICKASQLKDFNILTEELGKMFSNQNSKPHGPVGKPLRNDDFPRLPREENQVRQANDSNFPPPPPRDKNHPRPPRDENRPPPPRWDDNRPGRPGDEHRPPPPPRFDDEK